MVGFPEVIDFMEHERWGECISCYAVDGHPCYMIPESLYEEHIPTEKRNALEKPLLLKVRKLS